MNSQYSTAHKSVPYELVFGQLPHCDTNLVNLLENDNYSPPPVEASSSSSDSLTLTSETDSQLTIVSEFNDDIEDFEIDPFYFE